MLALAVMLCTMWKVQAQEQNLLIGSKVGIGVSSFQVSSDRVLWFGAGGFGDFRIGSHFGLMGEANFQKGGAKYQGKTTESGVFGTRDYTYTENFSLFDVQLNLLPRLSFGGDGLRMNLFAGPALNFGVFGNSSRTYDDASYNNDHGYQGAIVNNAEIMHFSGIAGFGFTIPAATGVYYLDFRYNMGLTTSVKVDNQEMYTNFFAITGGVAF